MCACSSSSFAPLIRVFYHSNSLITSGSFFGGQVRIIITPEPSTIILLGAGLIGAGLYSRRRLSR
ncbi:MAG: PEP-CTERM sorting domain-containing protein [Nitrospirae bacterium]|nr:PEP-CTERM sorting domain-containing protein [Nitrospirota bacterium]